MRASLRRLSANAAVKHKEMGKWTRSPDHTPATPSPTTQPTASTSYDASAVGSRFGADRPATGAPRQQHASSTDPPPTFRGQQLTWNAARDGPYRAPERFPQSAPSSNPRLETSRGVTGNFKPPQRPTYSQSQSQPLSSRRSDSNQPQSWSANNFTKAKPVDASEDSSAANQPPRWQRQQYQPQQQHQSQWQRQPESQQGDSSATLHREDNQRTLPNGSTSYAASSTSRGESVLDHSQERDDFKSNNGDSELYGFARDPDAQPSRSRLAELPASRDSVPRPIRDGELRTRDRTRDKDPWRASDDQPDWRRDRAVDTDTPDQRKVKEKEKIKRKEKVPDEHFDPDHVEKKKRKDKQKNVQPEIVEVKHEIYMPQVISVGNLAKLLEKPLRELQRMMIAQGMEDNSSHDQVLSFELASLLVGEYGKTAVLNEEAAFDIFPEPTPADMSALPPRPPVVTIMGHVDHGKTTLLDSLRSTAVAKGEAGGITQHIGAFSVPVKASGGKQTITFLDTPGHAAFSAMRARGASVTDIIVLVVAADDGVMEQTKEVIELIKKDRETVAVVVALNKVDREGADPDMVRLELMSEGIELESHGGDIPAVEVSGLTGKGLDDLVETLALVAELKDLRGHREGQMQGAILESRVVKGIGSTATVLVRNGTLKPGSHLICGTTTCKVRMMTDHAGKAVKVAYPGDAVNVGGWAEVPAAGEEVLEGASEKDVRRAMENRIRRTKSAAMVADAEAINTVRRVAKEQLGMDRAAAAEAAAAKKTGEQLVEKPVEKQVEDGPKELRIVLKADVTGSVEAVIGALEAITHPQAFARVIHSGVGDVTETDIRLANISGGIVVGFNVKCPRPLEVAAERDGVNIVQSGIIYRLTDDIRKRVSALIPPVVEFKVIGEATLLQLFEVDVRGKKDKLKVCGCRIGNGVVKKGSPARVLRGKTVIHEGPIDTLRHHKELVQEVKRGQECGLSVEGFADPEPGDTIQILQRVEKPVII